MSAEKWTKGDYQIADDGRFVYVLNEDGTNRIWAHVEAGETARFGRERKTSNEEAQATATLFAASSELYETLAAAREHIMAEAEARNYDPPAPTELVASMDYALKKARGEV